MAFAESYFPFKSAARCISSTVSSARLRSSSISASSPWSFSSSASMRISSVSSIAFSARSKTVVLAVMEAISRASCCERFRSDQTSSRSESAVFSASSLRSASSFMESLASASIFLSSFSRCLHSSGVIIIFPPRANMPVFRKKIRRYYIIPRSVCQEIGDGGQTRGLRCLPQAAIAVSPPFG